MDPLKLGPFIGINNRLPRNKLRMGKEGDFLADAVNVDVRTNGELTTRSGFSQVLAMPSTRSLWRNLFVSGTTLYALTGSASAPVATAILTGLAPNAQLSYDEHPPYIVFSDGANIWKYDGVTVSTYGVVTPPPPSVAASGNGSLTPGQYQVTVCYVSPDGERSGTSVVVAITLSAAGALELTNIPQLAGHSTDVYVTPADGSQLYRYDTTAATSLTIPVLHTQDIAPLTFLKERLPAGSIIRSHNGRLFSAVGSVLYYTDPWSPLFSPSTNYIPFPEPITLVEPCGNNRMYIAADATYMLSGEVRSPESSMPVVLPYKAVAGTGRRLLNSTNVCWMSERGLCIGTPEGEVKNVQETNVVVAPAVRGATTVREEDGMKQVITSLFDSRTSRAAARSYMDAEIIHQNPL